jgi:hypothetical protein
MELKPFKVKADLFWAFFDKPNPMSDKGDYTVDLCNLSDQAVKKIEEIGGEVKSNPEKPDQGRFITIKSRYAIKPTDDNGDVIDAQVGNGSKAVVLVSPYHWVWKGKNGIRFSPKAMTITHLVEYNKGGVVSDDDDVL